MSAKKLFSPKQYAKGEKEQKQRASLDHNNITELQQLCKGGQVFFHVLNRKNPIFKLCKWTIFKTLTILVST
jgi:hypothetical protein